jgi:hypothetical protein
MKWTPGEWDSLRLAAKAADRAKAAEKLRPGFEQRLAELGYGRRAIAHAFSALSGPDSVADALAELAQNAQFERSRPVPLDFEIVGPEADLPADCSLTITGVERDDHGIRIRYTIRPPLSQHTGGPCGEARDEYGHEYADLGGSIGLAEPVDRTTGALTMPLPNQHASLLRLRMSWSRDSASLWEHPAHEVRITLRGSA